MNVWRYTPGSGDVVQVTDFPRDGIGVRNMSSGAGVLAYTRAGAIYVFDPAKSTHTRLDVKVRTDGLGRNCTWLPADQSDTNR